MIKWIRGNLLASSLIGVLSLLLGIVYFRNTNHHFSAKKTDSKQEPSKAITFNERVFSFDTLDKVERYEDLPKFGLVPPEQTNHRSGKNLILLAIKANAFLKGDWVASLGFL